MTARTQSPAQNLFAARAQAEEQSRRVPISQLAAASHPPPAAVPAAAPFPSGGGGGLPAPLLPSWSAGGGAMGGGGNYPGGGLYQQQPGLYQQQGVYQQQPVYQQPVYPAAAAVQQSYPQQHNPFI